jgi:hypothetical protein
MANIICWICGNNLVYKQYSGTELLDDEGNKPCYECVLEAEIAEEEAE